ncbi:hypothetical protein PtB15_1B733 [Puccinia triticina]|nr:hypothetical protein PtB15_1B733 [Puccinia triticina]
MAVISPLGMLVNFHQAHTSEGAFIAPLLRAFSVPGTAPLNIVIDAISAIWFAFPPSFDTLPLSPTKHCLKTTPSPQRLHIPSPMAPQLRHGRPFPNLPSALAATSSTPSTGTRDSKKAILEPPLPPTSSPAPSSSPKINTIISTNKIAKSLASPIQTLPPPPSSPFPQSPPQAYPDSEDKEYLKAMDEAWDAFEAELDLKYGSTGPQVW